MYYFLRNCRMNEKIRHFSSRLHVLAVLPSFTFMAFLSRRLCSFPSKETCIPKRFFAILSENYSFKKKLLNNKIIFNTLFVTKRVMLIFDARRLLSLKNCQMHRQNCFSWFSQKILLFSKKLLNKKIFNI